MQDFFNWQGVVGTVIGVIGTIISIFVLLKSRRIENFLEREKSRNNEKVEIVLTDGISSKILPAIRRQEVTRSEVQGRIRLVPTINNAPYSIAYLNSDDFFKQIDLIVIGSNESGNTKIEIKCTSAEVAQFTFYQQPMKAKRTIKKVKIANGK